MFSCFSTLVQSFLVRLYFIAGLCLPTSVLHHLVFFSRMWLLGCLLHTVSALGIGACAVLNHLYLFIEGWKAPQKTFNAAGLPEVRLGCYFFFIVKSLKLDSLTSRERFSIQKHQQNPKERGSQALHCKRRICFGTKCLALCYCLVVIIDSIRLLRNTCEYFCS